jgi:mono/diheme cytochrome c family protein
MMSSSRQVWTHIAATALIAFSGCARFPGVPTAAADVSRPDKQLDFRVLYKQTCSGCHGDNGRGGAAISLNNPVYLAFAGADNLRNATGKGMNSTMMPAFASSSGGMLTEQQVDALVQGMVHEWSRPSDLSGVALPPYAAAVPGNPNDGQKAYTAACSRCHGSDGTGIHPSANNPAPTQDATPHSIVDPTYLELVSDQGLRSIVVAGHPGASTPDWRTYIAGRALTPQEITDIVAWLSARRTSAAQQSVSTPAKENR